MPVQHRQGPHRAVDQGPHLRAGHREGEDVVALGGMCRHILGRGQARCSYAEMRMDRDGPALAMCRCRTGGLRDLSGLFQCGIYPGA
jgi:hypothetical protein